MHNQTESFYETLDRCYLNGDMEGAERYLEQCAQSADGPTPLALIEAFNELGAFWRNIGGLSQSLRVFHRALALTQDSFGENCSEYASILNNMAGTYRLLRNFDQSARLYRQALDIYRLLGCETSYTYANVLGNLSLVLREDRQPQEAIQCLETALPILQALPAHRAEIAMAYSNLTTLYHAAGDHDQATRYLYRALQEFETCANEETEDYAPGLNSLAGFLYATGDCESALALYRRSAKYIRRFFGETLEYAVTYQNMRWVYEKLGRYQDAVLALTKAKKVYEQLFGPEDDRTRTLADDLRRLQDTSRP